MGKKQRILIVDDNVDSATQIARLIEEKQGDRFEVTVATNAAHARTCLREATPDIVISDMSLSDRAFKDPALKSADDLIAPIKAARTALTPRIGLIVMSGHITGFEPAEDYSFHRKIRKIELSGIPFKFVDKAELARYENAPILVAITEMAKVLSRPPYRSM